MHFVTFKPRVKASPVRVVTSREVQRKSYTTDWIYKDAKGVQWFSRVYIHLQRTYPRCFKLIIQANTVEETKYPLTPLYFLVNVILNIIVIAILSLVLNGSICGFIV